MSLGKLIVEQWCKIISIFVICILTGGCSGVSTKSTTDPFDFDFTPMAYASNLSIDNALDLGIKALEAEGYKVAPSPVFHAATTDPQDLGYLVWRATNEKWKVSYQLALQIIKGPGSQLYWKLTHRIVGSRSGNQNRSFQPQDFEETSEITSELSSKLANLFFKAA